MKPVSQDPHAAHVMFRNQINGCFDGIDLKGTKSPQLLAEMLKKVLERCGFAFEMTIQGNGTAGVRLFPLRKSTTTYRTSPEGLLCHALAPQSKVDGHNAFTAQSFPRRGTLRLFAAEAAQNDGCPDHFLAKFGSALTSLICLEWRSLCAAMNKTH